MGSPLLCTSSSAESLYQEQSLGANKMARWSSRCHNIPKMNSNDKSSVQQDKEIDQILELAMDYVVHHSYLPGLMKEKKRAVRKRVSTLVVDKGEVFMKKKGFQVKMVTAMEEPRRIFESCHSDLMSRHFGTTKT